jgi:hypothetical protein
MRGLFRTRQRKLMAVSVVGLVSLVGGLMVGINAASGTKVAGLGPLDHYLCYAAAPAPSTAANVQFPKKPVAAWLQNQFGSVLGKVGGFQRHCNPVQKTTPDGLVTPINKANDHLACWGFKPNPSHIPPLVNIRNQFSPADAAGDPVPVPLKVVALQSLCLPSFKSLTAANLQPGAPDDLDHYTCYSVAYPTGSKTKFLPPSPVQLDDQFSRLLVPAQSLRATVLVPQSLCLPTIKIVDPNPFVAPPTFNDLLDKTDHLLCFGLRFTSPAPYVSPAASVFDSNQFGIGKLNIHNANQLCVPSLKEVPPPPPTTTTTIAGVTTTTCDPAVGNCTTTTTAPCTSGPNCTSPPLINKSFGATQIAAGGTTSLVFSISNPNSATNLTGISFNDNLPPGLVVATPNGVAGGCPGGIINAPSGAPLITMTGATLPPLASCSFKVDVTATAGTAGVLTNVTDPITSNESGPGGQANATIRVG